MRVSSSKIFLVVLAALAVALGFVTLWVFSDDGRGDESTGVEVERPDRRGAETRASGPQLDDELSIQQEPRSERKQRRRLKSAEQRQKLIAAIELARAARLQGRVPADDGHGAAGDEDPGKLSKESIQDAVQAVIEDVKACYDEQLKLSPELGGKIIVDFTINAEEGVGGVVDSVEIGDGSDEPMRLAQDLTECIVDTIYTLELPEPEGGGTVDVSYPLVMSPGPRPAS